MSRWKILVSAPYFHLVLDEYREELMERGAELIVPEVNERLSENELLGLVGDIDGVIAGDDHFTEKVLLRASPTLKVISKWGTGIDAFDREACEKLGVRICNTPGAFTLPVADSVLGYILAFARRQPWMDQQMKSGIWDKIPGRSLNETVLGIIGFGNIGQAVAFRARAFGMKVIANDIVQIEDDIVESLGVQLVGKKEIYREADFVSLNCDLNPSSKHILDKKAFQSMKSTGIVVNTARGPLIDEQALISALESRQIAGAALDVFENEPLPSDSQLRSMSNVMLAPHNSNSSPNAWEKVHQNTIKNLFDALENQL